MKRTRGEKVICLKIYLITSTYQKERIFLYSVTSLCTCKTWTQHIFLIFNIEMCNEYEEFGRFVSSQTKWRTANKWFASFGDSWIKTNIQDSCRVILRAWSYEQIPNHPETDFWSFFGVCECCSLLLLQQNGKH